MRPLVWAAIVAVLAPPARAEGEGGGRAAGKASVYHDDATRVVTSFVETGVALPGRVTVGGHLLVDVVTSASVDVISGATRFTETRLEESARLGWSPTSRIELGAAYTHSGEDDWSSHGVQAGFGAELAERNARVEVAYSHVANRVGRAGDPSFLESLAVDTVEAGVAQLVDPRTQVGLTYTFQREGGWLQSPYRYVPAEGGLVFPEAHPDARLRHAVTLRGLRALGDVALDTRYRLYLDDWGIVSHTATAAVTFAPAKAWDVRLRARGYYQSGAEFWRERYAAPMRFMSADRELSTFWDAGAGAKVVWRRGNWSVDGKVELTTYRFLDYARFDRRLAVVAALGAAVAW